MEDETIIRKRGRPIGYRLSEEAKEKIRKFRIGTKHTQQTKDKISLSLTEYFKEKGALSRSIEYEYSYISEEAADWVYNNRLDIDKIDDVMTERRLLNIKQLEICLGSTLEDLFGHNVTPEFLLLMKEELEESGCSIRELKSLV